MKRLITSDWQLADNARDRYRTDFVVDMLPALLAKYKVDQLLVLGDITEAKDNHPAALVNEIVHAFHNLQSICEVIVLEGNHDYLYEVHPFFKFLTLNKISWISTPTIRDNCLFLPHTRDYKKEWKDIDLRGNYDFIFAHNIFTGVNTQTGHALAGIPPSVFADDAFCISGDVHEPQTFKNITYVGSPTLCDFGDNYQPRVLLLDDLNVKSIKVYGQQKRLVTVDWHEDDPIFQHTANENDIVKIQVHIKMQHVAEWPKIREYIEKWAIKQKFVINTIQPIVSYVAGARQKVTKSVRKSDLQYVEALISRTGADERTAQVGKEILDLG